LEIFLFDKRGFNVDAIESHRECPNCRISAVSHFGDDFPDRDKGCFALQIRAGKAIRERSAFSTKVDTSKHSLEGTGDRAPVRSGYRVTYNSTVGFRHGFPS
jgi:hypothetical protein